MRLRVDDAVMAAMLLVFVSVAPSPVYVDGSATSEQAKDAASGLPLWRVRLLDATDEARDPQRLTVTIAAATAPAVPRLAPVRLRGLSVSLWGEAPLRASLRADAVEPAPQQSDTVSSSFLSDIDDVAGGE